VLHDYVPALRLSKDTIDAHWNPDEEARECMEWLGDENHYLYALYDGGVMAGYTDYMLREDGEGELTGLFVRPKHRNRGYGLMLLGQAAAGLLALGCQTICVYNWSKSYSNSFYRKLGGVVTEKTRGELYGSMQEEDIFIFQLKGLLECPPSQS